MQCWVHALHNVVRTPSLSTFDSIELGRYSDDLDKETDDKVAVLEFELRKAYDTIKSLRGSLTEATGREESPGYLKGAILLLCLPFCRNWAD